MNVVRKDFRLNLFTKQDVSVLVCFEMGSCYLFHADPESHLLLSVLN